MFTALEVLCEVITVFTDILSSILGGSKNKAQVRYARVQNPNQVQHIHHHYHH